MITPIQEKPATGAVAYDVSSQPPATNPLDGTTLKPGQVLVTGPDYTGPRKTVIDKNNPPSWPAWITAVNGVPVDTGAPGGTFQAQPLADLVSSGHLWWPLLALGLLVILAMKARR